MARKVYERLHKSELHSVEFHDTGPDDAGRRRFCLRWWSEYSPGHPLGEHVRRLHAQEYHADPGRFAHLPEWKNTPEHSPAR